MSPGPRQITCVDPIALETGIIVYDALFLTLAEDADTVVITAVGNLLDALRDTDYADLVWHLAAAGDLIRQA